MSKDEYAPLHYEPPASEPLVESATSSGRYCHVVIYFDGPAPIKASLLFRTALDAAECARILRESRRPPQ